MIKHQLNHRSVRKFKPESLDSKTIKTLFDVAQMTSSSTALQSSSIINVVSLDQKQRIADICKQEYVAKAPLLLIFLVDNYRNGMIAKEKQVVSNSVNNMDRFFQGFTDAVLMVQNIINAAEEMDLGAVCLGSVLNDSKQLCEVLNLPNYVFPVLGLAIGYPDESPSLRPRMSMDLRVFEDTYTCFENYGERLASYDEIMTEYYSLREKDRPATSFTQQVANRLQRTNLKRQAIMNTIIDQGFDLKLEDNKGKE